MSEFFQRDEGETIIEYPDGTTAKVRADGTVESKPRHFKEALEVLPDPFAQASFSTPVEYSWPLNTQFPSAVSHTFGEYTSDTEATAKVLLSIVRLRAAPEALLHHDDLSVDVQACEAFISKASALLGGMAQALAVLKASKAGA